jgi:hypothetical protein
MSTHYITGTFSAYIEDDLNEEDIRDMTDEEYDKWFCDLRDRAEAGKGLTDIFFEVEDIRCP